MDPSIAPTAVHGDGDEAKGIETLPPQVLARRHRVNDGSEGEKRLLLGAQEGLAFEERDDTFQKVGPPPDHEHETRVLGPAVVLPDRSATESRAEEVEDLPTLGILADVELRYELPTGSRTRVPLDRHMERAFTIDETSEIRIQPFLLIVRTGQIVTAHVATVRSRCDMNEYCRMQRSFQQIARFIDSASLLLPPEHARGARSFLFCLALHVAMQIGPYLHRFPGVRHMASEDSGAGR